MSPGLSPDDFRRASDLFNELRDVSGGELEAALDRACAGNAAVRAQVLLLLRADQGAGMFLEQGVLTDATRLLQGGSRKERVPETVGHYRILDKLGAGGMGEVWRARDSKLGREVAIKILPEAFAGDSERMARFDREARVLASLNHPNIATIYEIEQGAIVMELVAGEDLTGPVPVETAIHYARQIAAGLEAAHEKGVVHRDLKPANIKVTADGVVKLLDFGLAKASEAAPASDQSPTVVMPTTQEGMILGTAAYMSPEQARGKPADKRADIWAFGVVLFELLAGKKVFGDRETLTDTITAVVKDEPDWKALPADTPPRIRRLLERCLRKDPKVRLRDIGEARVLLDEPEPALSATEQHAARRSLLPRWLPPWIPWVVGGVAAAVAIAVAGRAWLRPKPAEPIAVRFELSYPEGSGEPPASAAVQAAPSPDGRYIALIARTSDKEHLWVRPTDSPAAHMLDKTEGANFPFWSPEGKFIAFFADEKLKKIAVAGGSVQTLCDAPHAGARLAAGEGGTWNADGVIVFAPSAGKPLMRVLAGGGPATPVTTLDEAAGETGHSWPQFLPDGRHFLYFVRNSDRTKSGIYIRELGSTKAVLVLRSTLRAAWSPPGYLLFPRDGTLFAQRMDPKSFRLTGEPVAVAADVSSNEPNGRSSFAVSANGVLVYRGASYRNGQLAWYGRDGKRMGVVTKPGEYYGLRLAPDEKSVAFTVGPPTKSELWIMELATGVQHRAVSASQPSPFLGPWSPDGSRMAVNRQNSPGIVELTAASGKTRDLLAGAYYADDWSSDGRLLLCEDQNGHRLAVLPVEGGGQLQTINDTPYRRTEFRLSPDGRMVAYRSNESGRSQIFVASYPSFNEKHPVSIDGGSFPVWRKDGKELFFGRLGGSIMSVDIKMGAKIEVGRPKLVITVPGATSFGSFAPSADGKRFLVVEAEPHPRRQTMVVVNWTSELKQP